MEVSQQDAIRSRLSGVWKWPRVTKGSYRSLAFELLQTSLARGHSVRLPSRRTASPHRIRSQDQAPVSATRKKRADRPAARLMAVTT